MWQATVLSSSSELVYPIWVYGSSNWLHGRKLWDLNWTSKTKVGSMVDDGADRTNDLSVLCAAPYYTTLLILVGISNQGETAAIGSDLSSFRI